MALGKHSSFRSPGGSFRTNQFRRKGLTPMLGALAGFGLLSTAAAAAIIVDQWPILDPPRGPIELAGGTESCEIKATHTHVVLVDRTDRKVTTSSQTRLLESRLLNALPKNFANGDFIIVTELTTSTFDPIKVVWEGCSPGRGETASVWTQTPALVEETFQKTFKPDYELAVRTAMRPMKNPERTPLLAGIEKAYSYARGLNSKANVSIHVASDLLQHDKEASVYVPDRSNRSILGLGMLHPSVPTSTMSDTRISFLAILRPGHRSQTGLNMAEQQRRMIGLLPEIYTQLTGSAVSVDAL